jgi:hypothetical protein
LIVHNENPRFVLLLVAINGAFKNSILCKSKVTSLLYFRLKGLISVKLADPQVIVFMQCVLFLLGSIEDVRIVNTILSEDARLVDFRAVNYFDPVFDVKIFNVWDPLLGVLLVSCEGHGTHMALVLLWFPLKFKFGVVY